MRPWFLYLIVLAQINTYGQDTIYKRIIIDTIILETGVKAQVSDNFSFVRRADDKFVRFDNDYWNVNYYPSLNCMVKFLPSNDLAVGFVLDGSGGELELHHLENLGDTVHFRSFKIFNNCLVDSIVEHSSFYHHVDDTVLISYKQRKKTIVPTNSCTDTLKKVSVIVNGIRYDAPVALVKSEPVFIGCGYPTKKDERKHLAEFDGATKKKKRRYNSFSISRQTYRYFYWSRMNF